MAHARQLARNLKPRKKNRYRLVMRENNEQLICSFFVWTLLKISYRRGSAWTQTLPYQLNRLGSPISCVKYIWSARLRCTTCRYKSLTHSCNKTICVQSIVKPNLNFIINIVFAKIRPTYWSNFSRLNEIVFSIVQCFNRVSKSKSAMAILELVQWDL